MSTASQDPTLASLVAVGGSAGRGVTMMAQRVQRQLLDDLDGSAATRTVRFGYAGREYAIDLNDEHASELDQLLAPYLAHARRANGTRQRRGTGRVSRRSRPPQTPLTSESGPDQSGGSPDEAVADLRGEDTDAAYVPPGAPETASPFVPDGEDGGTDKVAQWPAEADEGCTGVGASSWS